MKRVLLIILLIFTGLCATQAQYDAQLSQYFMTMGYYNPSYAGTSGDLNMVALHRQQWVGIKGAPKSFFFTADMPVSLGKTNLGVGAVVFTESIGLFQNTHIAAQGAYKLRLFGGNLSVGVQIGMASISFDGTRVYIPEVEGFEQEDEAIPRTEVKGTALDLNAGLFYTHKHFYAGFGIMHIGEPELQLDDNVSTYIGSSLNFTAGYNIQLKNPLYELQPSVFLKTDMQSFQADITARMIYNQMFNGGLSWRVNESVILLLGATFKGVQVGYAYDFPTNAILRGSSGSHEIMLSYKLKLKKTKSGQYRHKSVRIL